MAAAGRADGAGSRTRLRIRVEPPFDLDLVARSHGWYDLPPFSYQEGVLETACRIGGEAADVRIRPAGDGLEVGAVRRSSWTAPARQELRAVVRRMLGLERCLAPFWEQCRSQPAVRWAARRGAGRLLCAPGLFEDLAKILFTTNCSWEFTRLMTTRLVERLGTPAPSGRKAFPTAERCARQSEAFFREEVRAGYRAGRLRELARRCAGRRGRRFEEQLCAEPGDPQLRRQRLGQLPGFGPYAVGQGLRLLGTFEDLALDSWCRARWCQLTGRPRAPGEEGIRRVLRPFPGHEGLALWVWLTAEWHGETSPPWTSRP